MSSKYKTPKCVHNTQLIDKLIAFETEVSAKHTNNLSDALQKAITSLCRYPLPVVDVDTAKLLNGVGDFIAGKIQIYLKELYPAGIPPRLRHLSLVHDVVTDSSADVQSSASGKPSKRQRISAVVNDINKNPAGAAQQSITAHLANNDATSTSSTSSAMPTVKAKKKQLPKYRSGAYGLLIALYAYSCKRDKQYDYLFEDQLKELAQTHTDSSMTAVHGGNTGSAQSHYSAFSSKKSLLEKEWIEQSGRPLRYTITDEGTEIAKQMLKLYNAPDPTVQTGAATDSVESQVNKVDDDVQHADVSDDDDDVIVKPEVGQNVQYEVTLLIDKRERGHHKDTDRSYISDELTKRHIPCERRQIAIGDVMWIAKQRGRVDAVEYVVDCIVERKKITDMWMSIKDGRYSEQRKRLQLSGVKRVMYIIEGNVHKLSGTSEEVRKAELAVESAISSLTMIHNILVQMTPDIHHTISSLVSLTQQLQKQIDKDGLSKIEQRTNNELDNGNTKDSDTMIRSSVVYKPMEYRHFRAQCEKDANLRVTDLFNLQLRQIKGCSADRSISIRKLYPTARHLYEAYEACKSEHDEELMLSALTAGPTSAKIGDAISKRIRTFFRAETYTTVADET